MRTFITRAPDDHLSVDGRDAADAVEPGLHLAGVDGRHHAALTVTIIVENFTGAIGTVIFVTYLCLPLRSLQEQTFQRNRADDDAQGG